LKLFGGLRVDGVVRGAVRARRREERNLVISDTAPSRRGSRQPHQWWPADPGSVHAAELIELQPKARVQGEFQYRALEMHHGAVVEA